MRKDEFDKFLSNASDKDLLDTSKEQLNPDQILAVKREQKLRKSIKDLFDKKNKRIPFGHSYRNKKVRWYNLLDYANIIPLSVLLVLIFGSIALAVYLPSKKPKDYYKYDSRTMGTVYKLESHDSFAQDFDGMHEITIAYSVFYTYDVNDSKYSKQMSIPNKTANKKYIRLIRQKIGDNDFPVKYNSRNPDESILDIYYLVDSK